MSNQEITDWIVRLLYLHQEDALTNYDNERDECRCGQQGDGPWNTHFAAAILAALREAGYEIVERSKSDHDPFDILCAVNRGESTKSDAICPRCRPAAAEADQ